MIYCNVSETLNHLRIVWDGGSLRIPFDTFYDNRHVRKYLLDFGEQILYTDGRFREWSVGQNRESMERVQALRTVVARHVVPDDRRIYVRSGSTCTYLTKGTVQLAVHHTSYRQNTNEFRWLEGMQRNFGHSGTTAQGHFATLEDSICASSDGDGCYSIVPDQPSRVKRLMEGSVFA